MTRYPDVAQAGMCPLEHFVRHGVAEGRTPTPLLPVEAMRRLCEPAAAGTHPALHYLAHWRDLDPGAFTLFDASYAATRAPEPDDGEPLKAYLSHCRKSLADPHPLFSAAFYLEQNPDVASFGAPLLHYLIHGGRERRDPHPLFDTEYYLSQIPQKHHAAIDAPLLHYLDIGAKRGLNPNRHFDAAFYLSETPELRRRGVNPLVHYVLEGAAAGMPTVSPRRRGFAASRSAQDATSPVSVVIPTYDRLDLLEEALAACRRHRGPVPLEFVVVDDGSRDGTADFLRAQAREHGDVTPVISENRGPGHARNLGAQRASHDIVLFMGDDIRPMDDDFFAAHAAFHRQRSGVNQAMLGKVVWPTRPDFDVNFVMQHIQGRHGEQFGYADMEPYEYYDWRFFYTANISVKKAAVADWKENGFSSAFRLAAFEDAELAYRLSRDIGLEIFYDPSSVGAHHHPYTFDRFVERQINCGRMAGVFLGLHPETRDILGLGPVCDAMNDPAPAKGGVADYLALFEGVRAWIRLLDERGVLGRSGFHKELIGSFFAFAYKIGFIQTRGDRNENVVAAMSRAFDDFMLQMRRGISVEVSGAPLVFA